MHFCLYQMSLLSIKFLMVWYIAVSPQKEEKGKPIFFSALSLYRLRFHGDNRECVQMCVRANIECRFCH